MKRRTLGLFLGLFILLAACSNEAPEPTDEPTELDSATPTAPALTTVSPGEEGYPAPENPDVFPPSESDDSSPGPAEQEGYPAPSQPESALDPYPGGVAVIEHPAGSQCEDPLYPNLESAIVALEEAGVTIQDAEEIELMVCEACGCPTSLHYRIQINPADLTTALSLGWQRGG